MIKYRVLPGEIKSKNDGDIHYISAGQLMRLYKVKPSECVIGCPPGDIRELKILRPDYNGNYTI